MRKNKLLGALLAALVTLVVAAPASAAVPRSFFGVVPQVDPNQTEFARMGQGKVGSYRWPLSWRQVEPTEGTFDWTATDNLMAELAANNMKPVPFVCCVPEFIHSDASKPPSGSAEEEKYKAFLRAAVERYGPNGEFWTNPPSLPILGSILDPGESLPDNPIEDWQIYNEPNSSTFYHPKPDPAGYAHLLEISSKAITGVDPGAYIVLGGMFGTPHPQDGNAIDAWKFLGDLYKRGAAPFFDAAASHPYSGNLDGIKFQIEKFRNQMKKHGDAGADIWVTEMGWGSKKHVQSALGKSKKGQAKILKKAFNLLKGKRGKWNIHGAMWFTFKDHDDPNFCTWCDSAGLFSKSFNPKPSWKKFVKFTGGKP
jgi:hypothetical protein